MQKIKVLYGASCGVIWTMGSAFASSWLIEYQNAENLVGIKRHQALAVFNRHRSTEWLLRTYPFLVTYCLASPHCQPDAVPWAICSSFGGVGAEIASTVLRSCFWSP